MPMWRCPHCGTPQAETARCWVCHRSSTACATCRHFRRSVAAQLGYCGLDRQRLPLRGDEIRACWEAAAPIPEAFAGTATAGPYRPDDPDLDRTPVRKLEFVEVRSAPANGRSAPAKARRQRAAVGARAGVGAGAGRDPIEADGPDGPLAGRAEPGWSLWGDADN